MGNSVFSAVSRITLRRGGAQWRLRRGESVRGSDLRSEIFDLKPALLVVAAGLERGQDAQIRVGEKPSLCLASHDPCERAEVLAAGHGAKMFRTDSRQLRDFVFGEDLLRGFDSDHFLAFSEPVFEPYRDFLNLAGAPHPRFTLGPRVRAQLALLS